MELESYRTPLDGLHVRTLTGSGASDLHFRVTLFRICIAGVTGAAVIAVTAAVPSKVIKTTHSLTLTRALGDYLLCEKSHIKLDTLAVREKNHTHGDTGHYLLGVGYLIYYY